MAPSSRKAELLQVHLTWGYYIRAVLHLPMLLQPWKGLAIGCLAPFSTGRSCTKSAPLINCGLKQTSVMRERLVNSIDMNPYPNRALPVISILLSVPQSTGDTHPSQSSRRQFCSTHHTHLFHQRLKHKTPTLSRLLTYIC
jgi:hypothetical protein